MKATLTAVTILAACTMPAAPAQAEAPRRAKPPADMRLIDKVIAVVNDDVITIRDLDRAVNLQRSVSEFLPTDVERPQTETERQRSVLESLVDLTLVLQEAKKLSLSVPDAEVEREVARVKQQNKWSDGDLEQAVRKIGYTSLADYRDNVRRELLRVRMLGTKLGGRVRVTEAEVDKVMRDEHDNGKSDLEVDAAHVLIRVPDVVSAPELKRLRELALKVRSDVIAAKRSFEDLAREHTGDPATPDGHLGWVARGLLEPSFEATLFKLKDGEVGPVTQTPYGFHVIKCLGRRRAPVADKQELVRRIHTRLTQQGFAKAYVAWMSELRQGALIDIRM